MKTGQVTAKIPVDKLPKTKCRAFRGAFCKGWIARLCGFKIAENPYHDVKGTVGHVTFSRAFMRYWGEGYAAAAKWKSERRKLK